MTDNGILIQDGDVATIEFNRRFAASPERVWVALTNGDDLASWLTPGTIEGRVGGLVELDFGEGEVITGEVDAFDPPALLSYTWVFPDGAESHVTFALSADGDGTMLRLTHERVPAEAATGYTPGWHAFLDRFGAVVAGETVPTWDERFAVVGPLYQG
ncbi:MAG: hypothetical protein BMS9Abin07_1730 [Acidimicrobiia bacterium]|nr:MAG: hypothetical protein BMS9Abin07_1730 [Acidimicrobiia bacterium]